MSKDITYTLNDNVVAKLQAIVGGGEGNSLIAVEDFIEAVDGKYINTEKLKVFLASKNENYNDFEHVEIPGILDFIEDSDIELFGINDSRMSTSGYTLNQTLTVYKSDIEEFVADLTSFESSFNGSYGTDGSYLVQYALDNYITLYLRLSESQTYQTSVYPLTLSDLASFLDAPQQ